MENLQVGQHKMQVGNSEYYSQNRQAPDFVGNRRTISGNNQDGLVVRNSLTGGSEQQAKNGMLHFTNEILEDARRRLYLGEYGWTENQGLIMNPEMVGVGELIRNPLSNKDFARQVVLSEPEADYDKHFQISTRKEKQRLLYSQIEDSAQAVTRIASYIQSEGSKLFEKSEEARYQELCDAAFGTSDMDKINREFSRDQRQGFRLEIIDFLDDMHTMQPYREEIQTNPTEVAAKIVGVSQFLEEVTIKAIPLGFVITVSEKDYSRITDTQLLDLDGVYGTILFSNIPKELVGKVALLNRGGDNTGGILSPEEAADNERHEIMHIAFHTFFKENRGILHLNFESSLQTNSDQQKLEIHQNNAELLRKFSTQYARDEIIAYNTYNVGEEYPFLEISNLGNDYARHILSLTRLTLLDNVTLDTNQRQEIYRMYQLKYQEYLLQMREMQWIAHRLRDAVGQEHSEALMQITPAEKFRRLAQYFGVRPNDVQELMHTDMRKIADRLSDAVTQIFTSENDKDRFARIDEAQYKNDFMAVIAYYPQAALPALLKIVQNVGNNITLTYTIETIQTILETNGGVIDPELGLTTSQIRETVDGMLKRRPSYDFRNLRTAGDNLIETINQLDALNTGVFI